MQIRATQGLIQEEKSDLVVVNLFEDTTRPGGALRAVDQALNGLISQLMKAGDLKGKLGNTHLLYTRDALPAPRVLITGLGPAAELTLDRVRQAAAAAARRASDLGLSHFSTIVHGAGQGGLNPARAAQAVVEGSLLGLYRFQGHKRSAQASEKPTIKEITIVEANPDHVAQVEQGAATGQVVAEVTNFARDLCNEPGNFLTPTTLARRIQEQASQVGLKFKALGEEEMEALGAGAFLGVARGSHEEAQFIILEHVPPNQSADTLSTVVLVGKAITFDSGGINLKRTEKLWRMKNDMAGGAAVAAALLAAARLNLSLHVVGLIPATENMPGGQAIKPGDVVQAMNGKTIEIVNTDAEGRQVLADALCYAARYKPGAVVDVATLTATIGLALGREVAGLFCEDENLSERLLEASELAGEPLWPMPIYQPYRRLLDSDVADLKNGAGREGGSINAALFLKEFAQGYPWAHLDIASTAWREENDPYSRKGASGFGTRLLIELLRDYAGQAEQQ